MKLTTLQYRIKDETTAKHLNKMAGSVNFVWNYCNEVNYDSWRKFHKTYSAFDLNNKTAGCAKALGLHSQTVQAVCDQYTKACRQFKKTRLSWRSRKRSLGWIPFKATGVKVQNDSIIYNGHTFRLWLSRPITGKVRFGSFAQNTKGHWFANVVIENTSNSRFKTGKECGIDLGLKTLITLSDGVVFGRDNLTKKYEQQLAMAQRARKKKRVITIHSKIKAARKDWNQKTSTTIIREYDNVVVGNVSSSKLKKTRMAKSVSDAGWFDFKRMLEYKAMRLGSVYKEVNESYSTVTCSICYERTGPSGLSKLGVREWQCSCCGTSHLRDVNAAKNILRTGHCTPLKESQSF